MTTALTAAAEAAQLTPVFDAARLAAELDAVTTHTWNVQRTHTYGGQVGQAAAIDWRVLPLRSLGGDPERTDPGGPGPQPFAPTRWLAQLPYLAEILALLPAPLNAVRLMALGPGAASNPHRDPKYRLDRGLVRLHIPITTTPNAVLVLDGVEHCWQPGTLWYGDFSREHLVRNTADTVTRIHLVIDALLTAELAAWFPASWQSLLTHGEVLFNRPAPATTPAWPAVLPYEALLPSGFADFDAAAPLDGSLIPARIDRTADDVVVLTVAGRTFALAPVDSAEFRFSGWSEQRTLQIDDGGLLLRVRRGRTLAERHVPAAPRTF
ncbi:aspartyl/asparaginyl beta-hydroxylase domain-containing protein [Streptomyces sp. NPDC059506]|uniref:aspartyl/asparaginyl beta-hydroxylase domain-containing protein n=1 Tax=Streptomyces sp. NPDC059506 TaxID=3347751 RepID=UPI00367ED7E4